MSHYQFNMLLLLVCAFVVVVLTRYSMSYKVPMYKKVFFFLADEAIYHRSIEHTKHDLMELFNLTPQQCVEVINNYDKGEEWFRECEYLRNK